MKFIIAFIACALAFTTIQAQEGNYVGIQTGPNFLESHFLKSRHCTFDIGYNFSAIGGYGWYDGWRLESEVGYNQNQYVIHGTNAQASKTNFHGNVYSWSGMLNGYYDIPISKWPLDLYIGLGIGADYVHQSIRILGKTYKGNITGFTWQAMTGISYCFWEDVIFSVGYRYHAAPLHHGHTLENHAALFSIRKFFCF